MSDVESDDDDLKDGGNDEDDSDSHDIVTGDVTLHIRQAEHSQGKPKQIEDKRTLRRNKVEPIEERRKTPNHPMPVLRLVPRTRLLLRHATSGTLIRVLKTTKQFTKQSYFYISLFLSEKIKLPLIIFVMMS